ncbi:MAG TPA: metallopeptidase TldD-related protein [Polyangiaceae bacterium]|jgi:PmbA protein|nr:metallopeptidase TldD-related protein [Polyangiaceae bacterium]
MSSEQKELESLAASVVERARRASLDVAEAKAYAGWELTVRVRLGEPELVQEAGSRGIALRVMKGGRVALTSTSDLTPAGLERLITDATELVELSEVDTFAGPARTELLSKPPYVDLDLYDESVVNIDADRALAIAVRAEKAALGHDPRITLSEGATFSRVTSTSALVLSSGFSGVTRGSYASLSVAPVAVDTGDKRRRGHYWTARRHFSELESPEAVGIEAARRTLRQLGPRKVPTCEAPVVFSEDMARGLVGTFAGCILGGAIWRKSSYLAEREGTTVASERVNMVDDPLVPRGPGSRAFDGEGLLARKNVVVENGVLRTFLLDSYSGRKLGRESTGNAARGGASVSASTTNFVLEAGTMSHDELVRSTPRGLYVTDMMGFGFNAITGDYSRGAQGFWIENGELAFPVSELTVSSNLDTMLKGIDAIANDLSLKTSVASPTFRVASMTIGGS